MADVLNIIETGVEVTVRAVLDNGTIHQTKIEVPSVGDLRQLNGAERADLARQKVESELAATSNLHDHEVTETVELIAQMEADLDWTPEAAPTPGEQAVQHRLWPAISGRGTIAIEAFARPLFSIGTPDSVRGAWLQLMASLAAEALPQLNGDEPLSDALLVWRQWLQDTYGIEV